MTVIAHLLAAGISRRMAGENKLLRKVGGIPVVAHLARILLASEVNQVNVVLRKDDAVTHAAVAKYAGSAQILSVSTQGMGDTIAAVVQAHVAETCHLIMPADMPEISRDEIQAVLCVACQSPEDAIVRPLDEKGFPGHPVYFGNAYHTELARLSGDTGARSIINRHRKSLIGVSTKGFGVTTDLDTRAEWDQWQAARS